MDLQVGVSMFSCFFLLDRRCCSLSTLVVHLVGFPANTPFASECIFSPDERTCHVSRFVLVRNSTVIDTLADKLLFILLKNADNNAKT